MKYIVCELNNGEEKVFLFPDSVSHDEFFDGVRYIKTFTGIRDWERQHRKCVAAGFVNPSYQCNGHSETLGIKSRPAIDTKLLKTSF